MPTRAMHFPFVILFFLSSTASASGPVKNTASNAAANDQFGFATALDGDTMVAGATDANGGFGGAYVFRWDGERWIEEATLTAPDGSIDDDFGVSVAISGNSILVGASLHDLPSSDAGAAYLFQRVADVWVFRSKLGASDASASAQFGVSVALEGSRAIVGAAGASLSAGRAYVFQNESGVWSEETILIAADASLNSSFGNAVALSGDTALVGALLDDAIASNAGAAYVFTRNGAIWSQQQKIIASDVSSSDRFGTSVALEGDTAVVGAILGDGAATDSGTAYVFTRTGGVWTEQTLLTPDDTVVSDELGRSVAISGDTVVLGANRDDDKGNQSGAIYVFTGAGAQWSQQAKLTAPDGAANDFFGWSVALDGDIAVVGAHLDDDHGLQSGSVYLFERSSGVWIAQDQNVYGADSLSLDEVGYSVDIDGDTAVVGARLGNGASGDSGAAYVFVRRGSDWVQQAKLVASDGAVNDGFGYSVAISGETVIVGANKDDDAGASSGSAYIFVRSGTSWSQQQKLTASDAAAGDDFGVSVAIDGDRAVIGASLEDTAGPEAGAAYVFLRSGTTWTQEAQLTSSLGSLSLGYGLSVALAGDTALIGAAGTSVGATQNGVAHVYTRTGSTWNEQSILVASDPTSGAFFGFGVDLDEDTAIVGSFGDASFGSQSGAAYVFSRTGTAWTQQSKLTAESPKSFESFGSAVSIGGGIAFVSAPGDADNGASAGSVELFVDTGDSWLRWTRLSAPTPASGDNFGLSVASDGVTAIVGIPYNDDRGSNAGAVFLSSVQLECLPGLALNATTNAAGFALADILNGAANGNVLLATPPAFQRPVALDYLGKLLSINSAAGIRLPAAAGVLLANGASLNAAPGSDLTLFGDMTTPQSADATLRADLFMLGPDAKLTVHQNASLSVQATSARLRGDTIALDSASLAFSGPVRLSGTMTMLSGDLIASLLTIESSGRFVGDGDLLTNIVNDDAFITIDSTLVTGDLTNNANGTVTVQIGTLTLLGSLTNNGSIVGDLQTLLRGPSTQPGDGFSVGGDYNAGAGASLLMSSDLWRVSVGGDFDVAINDNTRYDMADSTLRIGGALPTDLERMSADIGASSDGLDRAIPGHYPIGTLRLTGNVTNLVDNHDNDNLGQSTCEAIYVRNLVIDAGATLNTNGCPVYYETLTMNGNVDNPANLIQLSICTADFNGDNTVDGMDLAFTLSVWNSNNPISDLNGDGTVDGMDLAGVLAQWGPCD